MKFKELTYRYLDAQIKKKLKRPFCTTSLYNDSFCLVTPKPEKTLQLKQTYKPNKKKLGDYTAGIEELKEIKSIIESAKHKLIEADLWSDQPYVNDDASIKMHINLNNIGEIDEEKILDLIAFLINESNSSANDLLFTLKIINPNYHSHERFKDTDQITIYFDKYSSTADLIRLANRIPLYLRSQKFKANTIQHGPNDAILFNPFVSARFDTNKLHDQYHIYRFFDLELKKFFDKHADNLEMLDDIPLCGFEVVFHNLFTIGLINLANRHADDTLNESESNIVQEQFTLLMKQPRNYMLASVRIAKFANKSEASDKAKADNSSVFFHHHKSDATQQRSSKSSHRKPKM